MSLLKSRIGAFLGGLILFLILVGGAIAVFEFNYVGRFYPGVVFAGSNIGGMSFEEVEERVDLAVKKFQTEGVILTVKTSSANYLINVPMNIVGLSSDTVVSYFDFGDWRKELSLVYDIGRSGSVLKRIREQMKSLFAREEISMPYSIYESSLSGFLNREFANILSKQSPAYYYFNGTSWDVESEKPGESLSVDLVIGKIDGLLSTGRNNDLEIVVEKSGSETTKVVLSRYLDFVVGAIVPAQLRFKYNGYNAYLSGRILATWLEVDESKLGDFVLKINEEKLETFVRNKLGSYLENPMKNSRFAFSVSELVEISPGEAGNAIDFESLSAGMDLFLEKEYDAFRLPDFGKNVSHDFVFDINIKKEEPKITQATIDQYKIKELVAKASTSFAGGLRCPSIKGCINGRWNATTFFTTKNTHASSSLVKTGSPFF